MEKRLLTVRELSEYLGVNIQTLYQWTSQHKIRYIKIGNGRIRFDRKDIDKWIQEHSIEPRNF